VNGNVTYAVVKEPLNVKACLLAGALFALTFFFGYIGNKLKWTIRQRKHKHQSIK
jgi:hypothetical protein